MTIKIVDLFSGAGGLTFGFKNNISNGFFVNDNRFEFVFANEYDPFAAASFRENFSDIPMLEDDISKLDIDYFKKNKLDIENVDLIIGGPPCQSFSTVGKRQYDNRAKMYREYRRLLSIIKPKMFIFENVLGLLTMKNDDGIPVIDDVIKSFQSIQEFGDVLGYTVHKEVLNAQDFGVPQSRERVFLVGIRKDLCLTTDWEYPTPLIGKELVTVSDAISDLPKLGNNEQKNNYKSKPKTEYQSLMRGSEKKLRDHISANHGHRIMQIMEAVIEGEGKDYINAQVEAGELPKELFLTSGYRNTYGRLWWDRPSTTITNNLSTPSSLRCIHPKQNRALTPREGARLQSFPDSFKFIGPRTRINTQIGNAVPPLLSLALADSIYNFYTNNFKK